MSNDNFIEQLIEKVNEEFYPETDCVPQPSKLVIAITKLCVRETAKEIKETGRLAFSWQSGFKQRTKKCDDLITQAEKTERSA